MVLPHPVFCRMKETRKTKVWKINFFDDVSPKPVLRRLLPPLAAVVIILMIGAGGLLWQQQRQWLAEDVADRTSEVSGDLRTVLDLQAAGLAALVQRIAADPAVQHALRERDVDRLLSTWGLVFTAMSEGNNITHFYFSDPGRICLLRVHYPEKRGDRFDRFTALEAERTGKTASGIELGLLGTLTLRVVHPVFKGGTLAGYVELGKEIQDVLATLHIRSGSELAVVIHKKNLIWKNWEEGMRQLGRQADWDRLPRSVVPYTTQGRLPDAFAPWADHFAGDHEHGETNREIVFNGKDWRVSATSLHDASGQEVGHLLIMRDVSTKKAAFVRLLAIGGTIGVILLALLLGFICVLLRRIDRGIRSQQADLRESEERYRLLFDGSNDAILVHWLDDQGLPGRFTQINQEACRRLGFSREELLRMTPMDLAAPAMAEQQPLIAEELHASGSLLFETLHVAKDGRRIPVESHVRLLTIDGKSAVLSTSRDITKRKRVEEELRASEERYRLLLDSVTDFIYTVTIQDGRPISTTHGPGCRAVTGYTPEEGAADPFLWHRMIFDEDKAAVASQTDTILKGGKIMPLEHRLVHKDGSIRWVRNTPVPRYDEKGRLTAYDGLISDVTERKEAEEQLQKNQAMLASVFEGISEPLMLVDRDLRVKIINKAATEYYVPRNIVPDGKLCFEELEEKPETCKTCSIPSAIQNEEFVVLERKSFVDPERIEKVFVYPVKKAGKNTGEAIIRIYDITDEMRLKEEMTQADKLISLGTLVAGVAHEINNPNNYIMLNAPILQEVWKSIRPILDDYRQSNGDFSVAGLPYSEMKRDVPGLISGIEDGARRIKRIVQELREYSARESLLQLKPESINTVIRRAVSLLAHKIKKTTQKFRVEYGNNLPPVNGDFQKLEQVLVNLIQNALEALPDSSKGVSLKSFFDQEWRQVRVEIRDEGVGIREKDLSRVMDPFFSTKRTSGGTGLGLAVSRTIIRQHGGTIEVQSESGKGSVFLVTLPAVQKADLRRVLLVDDDPILREMMSAALSEDPRYLVTEASNGTEACIILGKDRPDLLLLDLLMPDMDGAEVCRTIKREPFLSGTRVILITGYPESPLVKEIEAMGFCEMLFKPFHLKDLWDKVERVSGGGDHAYESTTAERNS